MSVRGTDRLAFARYTQVGTILRLTLGLWLLATSSLFAEPFGEAERDALWRDARAQLRNHRRTIYHDGRPLPEYPAFLVTNETAFPTMRPPPGPAGMQVGFATTVNLNLLVARRNTTFVVADQSEEAVITMMSLYRPLFLASSSPETFLANLAGLEPRSGETLDQVFYRIANNEPRDPRVLQRLDRTLAQLEAAGKITAVDRRFVNAVIRDQIDPPVQVPPHVRTMAELFGLPVPPDDGRVPVYRNARGGTELARWFQIFYSPHGRAFEMVKEMAGRIDFRNPESVRRAAELVTLFARNERSSMAPLSFLEPEGYAHVRRVLEQGGDHYAQSRIQDPAFWDAVARTARARGLNVTDVYLSNIPYFAREDDRRFDAHLQGFLAGLPTERMTVYEADIDPPHRFNTQEHTAASLAASNTGCLGPMRRLSQWLGQ